jgi:hypothetical protein
MSQFIPLEQAIEMTSLYREENESILAEEYRGQNILARCETFAKSQFLDLLNQEACTAIRIYYGMDSEKRVHAIIVGVDDNNADLLPSGFELIIEESTRCPNDCPPTSDLNPE